MQDVHLWMYVCMYVCMYACVYTGSERNPRLLEISLEIPLGVLAVQPTRADWLDL